VRLANGAIIIHSILRPTKPNINESTARVFAATRTKLLPVFQWFASVVQGEPQPGGDTRV